jgi:hypothetical protein
MNLIAATDLVAIGTHGVAAFVGEDIPNLALVPSEKKVRLWVKIISPVDYNLTYSISKIGPAEAIAFEPRTLLGKKLLKIRNRAIKLGMRLLSEDEVLLEVKERRGELEEDDADLYRR